MNSLQPTEINSFLERFHSCDDGLIRSVEMRYFRGPFPRIAVMISTMDQQAEEDDGWANLYLEMPDVQEYSFAQELDTTNQVISGGIHISYYGELFFVNFGDL